MIRHQYSFCMTLRTVIFIYLAGARSGYALEFFCRARNLADLFFDTINPSCTFPDFWIDAMMETPMLGGDARQDGCPYEVVSLGGGPAFDFVGCALTATFCANGSEEISPIHATVFDYEEGWCDLVSSMDSSTRNILKYSQFSCEWGGKCDITKGLSHFSNMALLKMKAADMIVCQYCVAENSKRLQESNFIFFFDLFETCADGTLFILTETTPRVWPDFFNLVEKHCNYMQIAFNKNGRQMLLRKGKSNGMNERQNVMISARDAVLLKDFQAIATNHKKKVEGGYVRQEQKDRGQYVLT